MLEPPFSGGAEVEELPKTTNGRTLGCMAQSRRAALSSSEYWIFLSCGQGLRSSGECSRSRLSYQSPALPAAVPSACHLRNRSPRGDLAVVMGSFCARSEEVNRRVR